MRNKARIYIKVKWKHSHPQYPSILYSEVDENRWEIRKVELFNDGRAGFASADIAAGGTKLGLEPLPTVVEIANDSQFEPKEISQTEFESIWEEAVNSTNA